MFVFWSFPSKQQLFFHFSNTFLIINKDFIQEFLPLEQAALFKQKGALNLIDCFRNTTRTLFWENILNALRYLVLFV